MTAPAGISRRHFLVGSGAGVVASLVAPQLLPRYAFATPGDPAAGDVLVCVFLRGAADGLSLVPPFSDTAGYQALRGAGTGNDVAIPPPDPGDPANTAIDLGTVVAGHHFGLHPGATGLKRVWDAGHLAIVHAAGLPAAAGGTRSHFQAQADLERGTIQQDVATGWLGRHLTSTGTPATLPALGYGGAVPASLRGEQRAMAIASLPTFGVGGFADDARAGTVLRQAYADGTGDAVRQQGADTLATADALAAADPAGHDVVAAGSYDALTGPVAALGRGLREIAQLIRADVGLRVACIDFGNWDTHARMGPASGGWMRNQATGLSDALAAFHDDLGADIDEVTLVTMSEFGRTVNVNGNNGTDHGRGSCLFVMGGHVNRGIWGDYPAGPLADGPEGDLTVVNDTRAVLTEVLAKRCGAAEPASVFPGYSHTGDLGVVR